MAEQTPARPKNVVVVDADDPLVEVRGEFLWREDHERIVTSAREEAYWEGYHQGRVDTAMAEPRRREVVLRYRPSFCTRLRRWVLGMAVLAGTMTLLIAVILEQADSR